MEIKLTPLTESERLYTYRNSHQISMQTGLVGYLRADMGSTGKEFRSTWNDFYKDLNTRQFKDDLDGVINALREKGNILSDLSAVSKAYRDIPESRFDGKSSGDMKYFGFRVNTENHAFLLRLSPLKGAYNLYCYCYRRDRLDRHIKNAQRGIRFIDSRYQEKFRIPDGDRIRIQSADGYHLDHTCRYIDDCHIELDGGNIYHICQFAEMLERSNDKAIPLRSSLPDQCYVFVERSNTIGIADKGEHGYTDAKSAAGLPFENRRAVAEMNRKLGVTPAQAEAMKSGAMLGWDIPAADPKNYNERGILIKPKHRDYER